MANADLRPDRWSALDRPVLIAIANLLESRRRAVSADQVAQQLRVQMGEVNAAMRSLVNAGYLVGGPNLSFDGTPHYVVDELTERGLRTVGLWPSAETTVDALVEALHQAEEATDDPEEKGLIRRAAGAVTAVSRDIMVDVVAAVVARQSGLG